MSPPRQPVWTSTRTVLAARGRPEGSRTEILDRSITRPDGTSLTAVPPPGTVGPVAVRVSTASGTAPALSYTQLADGTGAEVTGDDRRGRGQRRGGWPVVDFPHAAVRSGHGRGPGDHTRRYVERDRVPLPGVPAGHRRRARPARGDPPCGNNSSVCRSEVCRVSSTGTPVAAATPLRVYVDHQRAAGNVLLVGHRYQPKWWHGGGVVSTDPPWTGPLLDRTRQQRYVRRWASRTRATVARDVPHLTGWSGCHQLS